MFIFEHEQLKIFHKIIIMHSKYIFAKKIKQINRESFSLIWLMAIHKEQFVVLKWCFLCTSDLNCVYSFVFLHEQVSPPDSSRPKYLNAVCMYCCTGLKSAILCRWCRVEWSGIDLVIGSCYNYDIFAASQCCPERRQVCTNKFLNNLFQTQLFMFSYKRVSRKIKVLVNNSCLI